MKKLFVATLLSVIAASAIATTAPTNQQKEEETTTGPAIESTESINQQRVEDVEEDEIDSEFVPGTPLNDAEEVEDIQNSDYAE